MPPLDKFKYSGRRGRAGQDKGAMGGELLLMSLGGCFLSNLLAAIRAREADVVNVRTNITGTLEGTPPRFREIGMKIREPST